MSRTLKFANWLLVLSILCVLGAVLFGMWWNQYQDQRLEELYHTQPAKLEPLGGRHGFIARPCPRKVRHR